jgi:hypothetical protein
MFHSLRYKGNLGALVVTSPHHPVVELCEILKDWDREGGDGGGHGRISSHWMSEEIGSITMKE